MKKKTIKRSKRQQHLTKSQQMLVVENMTLAMNMGRRYAGLGRFKGIPMEDLQQEACIGLCEAAMRFDSKRGADFKTYAYDWCKKYIMMAINGEPSTADEDVEMVADNMADDADEVRMTEERCRKVDAMMSVLEKRERDVICLIYGISQSSKHATEPLGFKEVAARLQLSRTRVHQLYECAMVKMEWNV